jgi:ELWxxDGT repeat protein
MRKRPRIRRHALSSSRGLFESLECRLPLSAAPLLTPQLVKDIGQAPESGSPQLPGVTVGKTTFFVSNDGLHGQELWETRGTEKTTVLVKDIRKGVYSYSGLPAGSDIGSMLKIGGTLYFSADDGVHGGELWKSNGTAAGTVMVKDIQPGSYGSNPEYLTNVHGTLYFVAYTGANGASLWKSNGTARGTVPVVSFGPGSPNISNFSYLNGKFYFNTANSIHPGYHVWISDGTAAGTVLAAPLFPGIIEPWYVWGNLQNQTFYIVQGDNYWDSQLWRSDGTLGRAKLVHDFSLAPGSYLRGPVTLDGEMYFEVKDNQNGNQLWKTDGTSDGTALVTTINNFSSSSFNSGFYGLTAVNGRLFFAASDGSHGDEEWTSDGTASGTYLLKDINPGSGGSYPRIVDVTPSAVFFTARDSMNIERLWKSDGTADGTVPISLPPGTSGTPGSAAVTPFYFSGYDSVHGSELWKSDGTARNTVFVKDIDQRNFGSYPRSLVDAGGTLFFLAEDATTLQPALFRTDGTAIGTVLLTDVRLNGSLQNQNYTNQLVAVGSTLYFSQPDDNGSWELWKSDGSPQGTVLVEDIPFDATPNSGVLIPSGILNSTDSSGGLTDTGGAAIDSTASATSDSTIIIGGGGRTASPIGNMVAVNDTLYFTADGGYSGGIGLWKSNGTPEGTVLVQPNFAGSGLTAAGDNLVFFQTYFGDQLWTTDPTGQGTVELLQVSDQYFYSRQLFNFNGDLYFTEPDDAGGTNIWMTDGTAAGTLIATHLDPNININWGSFTVANHTLFFVASDGTRGAELWKSDDLSTGVTLVKDIQIGSRSSYPSSLTDVNGTLFFAANDGVHGNELWKSDGTADGTVIVKDILPGGGTVGSTFYPTGSYPSDFAALQGKLVFTAYDGVRTAMFTSDGTAQGTVEFSSLQPSQFVASGGAVFFTADDGMHGAELWRLTLPPTPQPAAEVNSTQSATQPTQLAAGATMSVSALAAAPTITTGAPTTTGTDSLAVQPSALDPKSDMTLDSASNSPLAPRMIDELFARWYLDRAIEDPPL